MSRLRTPPLFAELADAQRVLVAGAGGGFDVYAGLPLAVALAEQGKQVALPNLSFSVLDYLDPQAWLTPDVARIDAESSGSETYFPERTLSRWLLGEGLDWPVYAFRRTGAEPLRAAYQRLVDELRLDAVVLVDGGTDILMRGDESGLGTPEEDMASLVAVSGVDVARRVVVCLGFGIDAYHGVVHTQVLENIAALTRAGGYLGALSIPPDGPEAQRYLDAVEHAALHTAQRPSIVNGQIAAAVRGEFGDTHQTARTGGSELFVNPLMAIYFAFQAVAVAEAHLFADALRPTRTMRQVALIIERERSALPIRNAREYPH